jgi:adenosylcobinamide-GDP ribazoletransferase
VVASSVPSLVAIAWTIVSVGLAWALAGTDGAIGVVIGVLAAIVLLVIARRRLGGITGDVLGATIEIAATATLLALALLH